MAKRTLSAEEKEAFKIVVHAWHDAGFSETGMMGDQKRATCQRRSK